MLSNTGLVSRNLSVGSEGSGVNGFYPPRTLGEIENDEFESKCSVKQRAPFEDTKTDFDRKLEQWRTGYLGRVDQCLTIVIGCLLTIGWYNLAHSLVYQLMVVVISSVMITVYSFIIFCGHAYGLSTVFIFKSAVLSRLIFAIATVLVPRMEAVLTARVWWYCVLFTGLDATLMITRSNKSPLLSSWLSIFIIDWGAIHCSSFDVPAQSQSVDLSVADTINDRASDIQCCQRFANWLHERRTSLISLILYVLTVGLLSENIGKVRMGIFMYARGVSINASLLIVCCSGMRDGIAIWPWLHRFIFSLLTFFFLVECRIALNSKLAEDSSSSVKFVLWQLLAIITALLLSSLTFTLKARSKATLRSNNLFRELINSSFIRDKNVLIFCMCVQWLLAQCSLILLLLPLDIYSANAHRSWLRDQYGRTFFYTQLFSLIPDVQLTLSFVEFWDDSNDDHSGRPSLSNALSSVFKCMIFSFALLPVSIYLALSGIINHPFDGLLWINLSLPFLKFVNVLILKWILQWNPLANEPPKLPSIRIPFGFPFKMEVKSWSSVLFLGYLITSLVFEFFLLLWEVFVGVDWGRGIVKERV